MSSTSVKSALECLAADSAKRLQALLDAGEEIPYEVNESDGTQLPQYSPMTERFVREHLEPIRGSEAFAEARDAIGPDQSGRYLEELALPVPPEPLERSEGALTEFLARVWSESSGFELDHDHVAAAVGEFEGAAKPASGDAALVTALIGLQIPLERLELAGATIVRADMADVPAEARQVERSGTAPWEPVFLAILRAPRGQAGDQKPESVGAMLRRLITTLRLFKPGGVATGPHAWVSAGAEKWRRVSTGAPRPRTGGYRLAESELGELADLARAIRDHPRRLDRLRRAMSRFDAGIERGTALDSLNDHLLALRYMLEGDGPARTGLAMRAAALSPLEERDGVRAMVERAEAIERELWSGEPARGTVATQTPAQLAGDIEDLVRRILREAARGRVGSDLRAAADEALLGDGLAIGQGGEGDLGGSAEWGLAGPSSDPDLAFPDRDRAPGSAKSLGQPVPETVSGRSDAVLARPTRTAVEPSRPSEEAAPAKAVAQPLRAVPEHGSPAIEKPAAQLTTTPFGNVREAEAEAPEQLSVETALESPQPSQMSDDAAVDAWIDEIDVEQETIEWPVRPPASEAIPAARAKQSTSERVTHLFPRAEVEWKIGELPYDRSRRPRAS